MRKNSHFYTKLLDKKALKNYKCLIGFDGFVDTLYTAVSERKNAKVYVPIKTISEFADRIGKAAHKGTNIEIVPKCTKIGGNGPILANACASYSLKPCLIGSLGEKPSQLFKPLIKKLRSLITLGEPGYTDAVEFSDGKIMLGKHSSILTLTEQKVIQNIKKDHFENLSFFASVNWTMLLMTTKLWKHLQEKIFPSLKNPPKMIFVDLADPAKRSSKDIKEALSVLKKFKSPVTLGLNEFEAKQLLELFGVKKHTGSCWNEKQAKLAAKTLLNKTSLHRIFIHTLTCGAIATKDEVISASGFFVKNPKISTGGGDNCNAGFLFAKTLDASDELALHIALWTASYYVKHGKSPSISHLKSWLTKIKIS